MSVFTSEDREAIKVIRTTLLLAGVFALLFGIAILVWPGGVAKFLVAILAAYLIVVGLAYLGLGFFAKQSTGWARVGHLLLGVIYIGAGVFIFVNLATATAWIGGVVTIIVAIAWIIDGIISLSLIGDASSKVWTVIYALVSIAGGVVLLTAPFYMASVLWLVIGITLVVMGLVQIVRAISLGRALKA